MTRALLGWVVRDTLNPIHVRRRLMIHSAFLWKYCSDCIWYIVYKTASTLRKLHTTSLVCQLDFGSDPRAI